MPRENRTCFLAERTRNLPNGDLNVRYKDFA